MADQDSVADIADDLRRIGEDIIAEREALLAIVRQYASPALLAALSEHLSRPVRIGSDEPRAHAATLH